MAKLTFRTDECKGCGLCTFACPKKILKLDDETINKKGHHPVTCVDQDACIGCASCAIMCPDCIITVER
ncbi:MAG: 4Fe-4S binding protein [Lachnospiraceae bacterium]|nr:4Fe-4S binding protein [Lachnospiraceae bacterium]